MDDQDTSALAANPREDDRNDEPNGSPLPDPEENGDAGDDPDAD